MDLDDSDSLLKEVYLTVAQMGNNSKLLNSDRISIQDDIVNGYQKFVKDNEKSRTAVMLSLDYSRRALT
jgi:hypothetical protein